MDWVHGVVHGPGPWGGPMTGSTGVVHGPGSMFCIRPLFAALHSSAPALLTDPIHNL